MRESSGGIGWQDFGRFDYLTVLNLNALAVDEIDKRNQTRNR